MIAEHYSLNTFPKANTYASVAPKPASLHYGKVIFNHVGHESEIQVSLG